ncbi:hypothetical protein ABE571_12785 [Stenotrophomonas sp. TWI273]|jgi:hypothetical protein|uniref:hypothetical protein n=1 Tax=unclassified Stenotrophomonas TaxID=196198 RepID=UPI00320B97DE
MLRRNVGLRGKTFSSHCRHVFANCREYGLRSARAERCRQIAQVQQRKMRGAGVNQLLTNLAAATNKCDNVVPSHSSDAAQAPSMQEPP